VYKFKTEEKLCFKLKMTKVVKVKDRSYLLFVACLSPNNLLEMVFSPTSILLAVCRKKIAELHLIRPVWGFSAIDPQ